MGADISHERKPSPLSLRAAQSPSVALPVLPAAGPMSAAQAAYSVGQFLFPHARQAAVICSAPLPQIPQLEAQADGWQRHFPQRIKRS